MLDGSLYKRGYSVPLLRCIDPCSTKEMLEEFHIGTCGTHGGPRALASWILRYGYYWPRMHRDAKDFMSRCDKCQRFATIGRCPTQSLHPIVAMVPFEKWGLNFIGSFPMASWQCHFIIIAVDFFSKWVEAEAMADPTTERIISFVRKEIICRYGVPRVLQADNGTQFASKKFTASAQRGASI